MTKPEDVYWCSKCERWDEDCICEEEPIIIKPPTIDVQIQNEGSIFILWAMTDRAVEWLEANCASAQRWGVNGYVVEHRYVDDIAEAMINSGMEVR